MRKLILIFPVLSLFMSCYDCEDITEPTLKVNFANYDNYRYYEFFYGLGGSDTLPMSYELPIAINSDTSTYLFIDSLYTDTLSISYHRTVRYEKENCGFSVILDSFKLLNLSTFDNVEFSISDTSHTYFGNSNRNEYEIIIYH